MSSYLRGTPIRSGSKEIKANNVELNLLSNKCMDESLDEGEVDDEDDDDEVATNFFSSFTTLSITPTNEFTRNGAFTKNVEKILTKTCWGNTNKGLHIVMKFPSLPCITAITRITHISSRWVESRRKGAESVMLW